MLLQSVLGSATDLKLLQRVFNKRVDIIFHAAAYKHVPLVEVNPLAGLDNNVVSTVRVCAAAIANGVRQVVLISTDKAVRPTNVMGASKRLAELVVQAHAVESNDTSFSMVRWECIGFVRIRGAFVSAPDRCRWTHHPTHLRLSATS